MGRFLYFCLFLSLVAPSLAQWKTFTETRTVKAKNKPFVCKYQLRYKGSITVDKKKSKVTCKPESKGNFGTVSETFVIGKNTIEVVHDIKKGKDTVKAINIAKLTTSAPTTAAPTTAAPTTPAPTGTGGGNGGTGGGEGTGGTGGTGATGGEEMSCSCKLPLLDNSSFAESGRKLSNVAATVLQRKKRSATEALPRKTRGHNHPSNSYSSGNALGSLVQVVILASLAALAAYGKVTLIQNLAGLAGRSLNTENEEEEVQARILSVLSKNFDRQDLGSLLGGLGGLLGGAPSPSGGNGGTNELVEGLVEQAIQQQINEFLTGGGIENALASLLESEDLGQMMGEMVNSLIGNMDTENMINTLSAQLGTDLGEIVSMLDQAVSGTDMAEVLGAIMGEMPEGQMESLLEGVNLNTMEMMMNCECQKKN